jgi:predicted small secreted protein
LAVNAVAAIPQHTIEHRRLAEWSRACISSKGKLTKRSGLHQRPVDKPNFGVKMKTCISLMFAGAVALSLTACNTMQGAGKDIERGGEKIQDAARKVRNDWRAARDRNEHEYEGRRGNCAAMSDSAQRDACWDRAHAEYTARMNEERARYRRNEMRSESDEDRREDAYDAARDRCEALRGAAEDRCIAEARAQYRR